MLGLIAAVLGVLSISIQVDRTSYDLLDALPVSVVVHISGNASQSLQFPAPTEYVIEVARDGATLWSSAPPPPPPSVRYAPHKRTFTPGATTLAVYVWNEIAKDGTSPEPGTYLVRARLLLDPPLTAQPVRVKFTAPLPPGAVATLPLDQVVTISGTLDATRGVVSDERGSATLARRIVNAQPGAPIVVRGHALDHPDGTRTFVVSRWAPLGQPEPGAGTSVMPPTGPMYQGPPDLPIAAAFVSSGGMPFSIARAADAIGGAGTADAILSKIPNRDTFVKTFDFAVNDAWTRVGKSGMVMTLQAPASPHDLGAALVRDGTMAPGGTLWSGYMFDRLFSRTISQQTNAAIDAKFGAGSSVAFYTAANTFFYELSKKLGVPAGLAPLH